MAYVIRTFFRLYDPYHLANLLSYAHPPLFYLDRKVQTIKDLEKPWAALMPRRLRPDFRLQPKSSSPIWTGHSAATTLLLDDSPAKAVLQPHNQLCVPEYTRTRRNVDLSVLQLEHVVQQLQQQQQHPSSVSPQEDSPATTAATTSTNSHEHAVISPDTGTTEQQLQHPSVLDQKDPPTTADATTDANAREHAVSSLDGIVVATEQQQPSSVSHQEDSAATAVATTSTNAHEHAVSSPDGTGTTTELQQQPSVSHQEDSLATAAAKTTTNAHERAFSSPEGSGTSTEQEQLHNKRKRKKTKKKKDNTQALALQQQQLLAAISADGASPAVFDETLLAVIGILHAARLQSSIAGWLRAGALFSPPSSERADLMGVNDKIWCHDPVLVHAWASRGREAMRELGLKVEHGIES